MAFDLGGFGETAFSKFSSDLNLKQGLIYFTIGSFLLIFFVVITKTLLKKLGKKKEQKKSEHELEKGKMFRGQILAHKTKYKKSNKKFAQSLLKRWETYNYLARKRQSEISENASREYIAVTRFLKKQFSFFKRLFSKSSTESGDYWKDTSFKNNITNDEFFENVTKLTAHILKILNTVENIETESSEKLQKLELTGLYEYGYLFKKLNHNVRTILLSELFFDSIIFDINFELKQLAEVIEKNYIITNSARENLIATIELAKNGVEKRLETIEKEFANTMAVLEAKSEFSHTTIKIEEEDVFSGFNTIIDEYNLLENKYKENLRSLYGSIENVKKTIIDIFSKDVWFNLDQEGLAITFNEKILGPLENLFKQQITGEILESVEKNIIDIIKETHNTINKIDAKKKELKNKKPSLTKEDLEKEDYKTRVIKYNIIKNYLQKILKELEHKLEKTHKKIYGPEQGKIKSTVNKVESKITRKETNPQNETTTPSDQENMSVTDEEQRT